MKRYPALQDIIFLLLVLNVDPSKSASPDNIPSHILKLCAAKVSSFLQFIFTQSFNEA